MRSIYQILFFRNPLQNAILGKRNSKELPQNMSDYNHSSIWWISIKNCYCQKGWEMNSKVRNSIGSQISKIETRNIEKYFIWYFNVEPRLLLRRWIQGVISWKDYKIVQSFGSYQVEVLNYKRNCKKNLLS